MAVGGWLVDNRRRFDATDRILTLTHSLLRWKRDKLRGRSGEVTNRCDRKGLTCGFCLHLMVRIHVITIYQSTCGLGLKCCKNEFLSRSNPSKLSGNAIWRGTAFAVSRV